MFNKYMGDPLTCTTVMCSEAKATMDQMWSIFNMLTSTYQNFDPAKWQPAVKGLQDSFDANSHWWDMFYPFNPACCTQRDIAGQALILTNQMLQSVGANIVPAPPPGTDWITLAVVVGGVLLLTVYAPQIKSAFKK